MYYDYDQIIPTQKVRIPKPKHAANQPLNDKDAKFCERFGSMYGIDTSKHKCRALLRMNENSKQEKEYNREYIVKKSTQGKKSTEAADGTGKEFAQDYADDFWRSTNSNSERVHHEGDHFSQDYADDLWRSINSRKYPPPCTLNDIINNKCKLNLQGPQKFKFNRFSNSPSDGNEAKKSMHRIEKYSKLNDKTRNDFGVSSFAQDYVDDFWRSSTSKDPPECSLSDVFNDKCKLNLVGSERTQSNRFSGSKSNRKGKLKHRKETNSVLTDKTKDDLATALFAPDYVDDMWAARLKNGPPTCTLRDIVNNKCKLNADALADSKPKRNKQIHNNAHVNKALYADDYVDDIWRSSSLNDELFLNRLCESRRNDPICVSRRNNYIQFRPNQLRSSPYSDASGSEENTKRKVKPKRFQIIENKKAKKNKFKKEASDSDSTVESEKWSGEKSVESIKHIQPINIKSEDSALENELTDIEEIDTSDSFETGPKKLSDKYEYLQGHRLLNPKGVRRASRLQTFLPKRYHWKFEDLHNLGYFWFEGPTFPDDKP